MLRQLERIEAWLNTVTRFPERVVELKVALHDKPALLSDPAKYEAFVVKAYAFEKRISGEGYVLIDGANVMHNGAEKPLLSNLELAMTRLQSEGHTCIVFVDANIKYQLEEEERKKFETMLQTEHVRQVPAGTQADIWVLQYANDMPRSRILSNDRFEEWTDEFPVIFKNLGRFLTFMIDGNEIRFASRVKKPKK
jgi:hypothetical protein